MVEMSHRPMTWMFVAAGSGKVKEALIWQLDKK
jgi:hypothetical protein